MTQDPGSEYRPVRRTNNAVSPVQRLLAIRNEALVDQGRIRAETASQHLQVSQRIESGYDLAMQLAARSAGLRRFVEETGNAELRELQAFILGAATEAIVDLIKGYE